MIEVGNLDIYLGIILCCFHNGMMGNFLENVIDLMAMMISLPVKCFVFLRVSNISFFPECSLSNSKICVTRTSAHVALHPHLLHR
jgi:hypothetical protein